ncbi:hypothetical protein RhiirA1_448887 [Rhizophagus irregularis]|uniref:Uncharacterized protein n=1 Tax=Rhizophagus irregularis TaxID=588596 RepID=A0A2N0SIL9_9GLOM|nr:hypothetical protein RhiirA1_448887 [Rhizophagus irregularis]
MVPRDLTDFFINYIPKKKKRFELFVKFMNIVMDKIDTHIWKRRNATVKEWECSLNITKKKKKFYKLHNNSRRDHSTSNEDETQRRHNSSNDFNSNTSTPYSRSGWLL